MKYAYPQDPTTAISSIRRADEKASSTTQQSSLERQQDIAIVGQTVPLIFCNRFDWGSDLGENGGVWISPLLIQLGIEQTGLSMMYILSQGEVTGLKTDHTYWGYQKLNDLDPDASMCFAYEAVPACLDLDYVPGGSVSWDSTITGAGPSLGSKETTYKLSSNCRKVTFTFESEIQVSGSYKKVDGYSGFTDLVYSDLRAWPGSYTDAGGVYLTGGEDCRWAAWRQPGAEVFNSKPDAPAGGSGGNDVSGGSTGGSSGSSSDVGGVNAEYRRYSFARLQQAESFLVTSEVRYDWELVDLSNDTIVKSGQIWIKDGNTSLTIDMPAGEYEVRFKERYSERDNAVDAYTVGDPGGNGCTWASHWSKAWAAYNKPALDGFMRATPPGSKLERIGGTVVQTIYNELSFPELPGGGQQLVGGLEDLTLMGIEGDVTLLRPVEGPNYFMQAHVFVEQGVQVERLTDGGIGPSSYYGDLVNYLLDKTEILQKEQIDVESLKLVNKMNERYKIHFNGVLQVTTSFSEWLTRTAPYFLATPRQVDGRYGLAPVCPLNGNFELSRDPVTPVMVINGDDIIEGSYSRNYVSARDRRPICLIMVYKDQPITGVGQTVTVEVRYKGTALSGPFESHDLTDFCCRPEQAVLAARYILAKRRFTTHSVSLAIGRRGAHLAPGDIIRVDLSTTTSDGAGLGDSFHYQVDSVTEGQGGEVYIDGTHYPLDENGVSIIATQTHEGEVSIS